MPTTDPASDLNFNSLLSEPTGGSTSTSPNSSSNSSEVPNSPSRALEAPTDYSSESDGGLFSWMDDDSDSDWSLFDDGQSAGGVESGKKPVVIISHGIGTTGMNMSALARQFEDAGYHVETPTDTLTPFDGSGAVDAYNRLEAQNNPELDLNNVVLVGHSAGGAAAQQASDELGDNVAGVITIDGAPSMSTNREVPHANFSHLLDPLGMVVGFENYGVPTQLRSNEMLFGGHTMAMTGMDGRNYVDAADEMLGR
jgi:pimeloyl-ACP methyl ester carboxylesterase